MYLIPLLGPLSAARMGANAEIVIAIIRDTGAFTKFFTLPSFRLPSSGIHTVYGMKWSSCLQQFHWNALS